MSCHANNTHGSLYSFYINVRKMMLSKPKGYKEEDVQALLSNADSEEQTTVDKEEMPNIIAIMNESFSDLNVVGDLIITVFRLFQKKFNFFA